ncbi:hypothetical protein GCM10027269_10520 [Kribbella endophytica]
MAGDAWAHGDGWTPATPQVVASGRGGRLGWWVFCWLSLARVVADLVRAGAHRPNWAWGTDPARAGAPTQLGLGHRPSWGWGTDPTGAGAPTQLGLIAAAAYRLL